MNYATVQCVSASVCVHANTKCMTALLWVCEKKYCYSLNDL